MSSVFGDDAGFFAGHAISEQNNAQQKHLLADALVIERSEKNSLLHAKRNEVISKINEIRSQNLMNLADFEYEAHALVDVYEDLGHVGERLKTIAESAQLVDKNELKILSDRLFDAREIHRKADRESWIQARWKILMQNCRFPKNDEEAIIVGGYAMPFPGSLPALLKSDKEALAEGRTVDVYRALTDPQDSITVQSKMQRGPMTLD
jgi:hypothetical protein